MIDPDQPRNYHRQQVLYALQQGGEPMTAWEVHEGMTTLALAMGHLRECAAITPAAVAGILCGMFGEAPFSASGHLQARKTSVLPHDCLSDDLCLQTKSGRARRRAKTS